MIDAKILVIIPAYNEQASIARVIERVKESVPAADIVVINDGSHDSTSLAAYESGANKKGFYSKIHISWWFSSFKNGTL